MVTGPMQIKMFIDCMERRPQKVVTGPMQNLKVFAQEVQKLMVLGGTEHWREKHRKCNKVKHQLEVDVERWKT